ncbi:methyl-accepting chemotaxis protein [uncultured Desulfobacter sp.]|uniref:methyl-accepting chemotaxis protein n=1 Tax=uncultured Desulfobacter sp. TaxID=240139 RepID=UPI002AAAC891|nr:methyl-accepting chemotaxis protein [uncultured Desulfobacter sp.]
MKLNIGTKVNLLIVVSLLLVGGAGLGLSVSALNKEKKLTIEEFRKEAIHERRMFLKSLIDSAYAMAKDRLDSSRDKETVRKYFGNQAKSAVNQAFSFLEADCKKVVSMDEKTKKQASLVVLDNMRWGPDNREYLWVHSIDGDMIHHPMKPSLDGKNILGMKDPDGKELFKEMNEIVKKDGEGFVSYKWPKPGFDTPQDKISYVKLFKPWGWVLGSGIYLEFTEEQFKQAALTSIGAVRYGKDSSGYYFIYDSKGNCILHPPKPEWHGTNKLDLKDNKGNFIIREMIKAGNSNRTGGYFEYYFPRPGSDEPLPKLSICRKLEGWDWYIATGVYTDDVDNMIEKQKSVIHKQVSKTIVNLSAILLGIILISLIVSYIVVAKGIVAPIRSMIDMLKDVAQGEGDLTKRIEDNSGDETQELAKWFNVFIENIQQIIAGTKSDIVVLNESSSKLASISSQMEISVEDTSGRLETVAKTSGEMSDKMGSMAVAMEEASSNISMISSAAEEMRATIDEIAKSTEKARDITISAVSQTRNASERVGDLGQAAREIFNVVETITDISAQVNLLALNATIEAARAGEAGKGFAVVANEIKGLAGQTSEASDEIKQKVTGIQSSTQGAVQEISSITQVVNEVNDIVSTIAAAVSQQAATTGDIAENVSQASVGIEAVNENVAHTSTMAKGVAGEVAQAHESSSQMADSGSEIKKNANELSSMAKKLSQVMNKFKV